VPLDSPGGGVAIDLVGISDLHGYIESTFHKNPETGEVDINNVENPGVTSLACQMSRVYRANPNALFVSSGDNIGASYYRSSYMNHDEGTLDVLNRLRMGVSALGVHELDHGLGDLEGRVLPYATFPMLAANVSGSDALSAEGDGRGVFIKEVDGVRVGDVPAFQRDYRRVEPVFESFPGWDEDISSCRTFGDLPRAARDYVLALEELSRCPISLIGVGADREQTIVRRSLLD